MLEMPKLIREWKRVRNIHLLARGNQLDFIMLTSHSLSCRSESATGPSGRNEPAFYDIASASLYINRVSICTNIPPIFNVAVP
jgi:hypothetical protein